MKGKIGKNGQIMESFHPVRDEYGESTQREREREAGDGYVE